MTWPVRVWAVGEVLTAANMIAFVSDTLQNIDDLLDLAGPTVFTDGGILLGSGAGATFTPMAVLPDGSIVIGDGATDPVALAAFTSSTGFLKHENGGLEFSLAAVTTGDTPVGTASGVMGLVGIVSQVVAEAGTATTVAGWTAERVKQAIDALAVLPQGAKFWVTLGMDAVADDSENLSSIDDDGTGRFGLNFTTDFAAATYAYTLGIHADASFIFRTALAVIAKVVGSIDVGVNNDSDAAVEVNVVTISVACYGALV